MILKKHEYAKNGINIWVIIFLIAAPGLQFFGRLLEDFTNNFMNADLQHYVTTGTKILIGAVVVSYTKKTVETVVTASAATTVSTVKL